MASSEQTKEGVGQKISQVIRRGIDVVIGHDCYNCTKSTIEKIDGQSFCSTACHSEFQSKWQAFVQKRPLCCFPGCWKPCYCDQGRYLEFCGRTHGQKFKKEYRSSQLFLIMSPPDSGRSQIHSSASPKQRAVAYHHQSGRPEGTAPAMYSHHSGASAGATYTRTTPSAYPTNEPIHFYHSWQPYYEFTNFSLFPILIFDQQWPTSEHFFQAQKFVGTPLVEAIRRCNTPREAFDVSRSELGTKWLRKDWSEQKVNVMRLALRAKFTQHQFLHDLLLSTGDRQLVEHTSRDSFWGDGGDGRGQNILGHMLMELRQELRHKKLKTNFIFPYSSVWETTQGIAPYPVGVQPATSSQNVHHSPPNQQSHSQSQAPYHVHEHVAYEQRNPSYSGAVKNQISHMDCS